MGKREFPVWSRNNQGGASTGETQGETVTPSQKEEQTLRRGHDDWLTLKKGG